MTPCALGEMDEFPSTYLQPVLGRGGQERQLNEVSQLPKAWLDDRRRRAKSVLRATPLQGAGFHVELLDGPAMVHGSPGEQQQRTTSLELIQGDLDPWLPMQEERP